jgi:hypothetical protein
MRILRTLALPVTLAFLLFGAASTANPPSADPPPPSAALSSPDSDAGANATQDVAAEEAGRASEVLEDLAATYRHLEDVTVAMGATPQGEQAVAYYTEGQIVVSPAHTHSIERILAHEVWHVIDWRDNGQLDWGENLPPSNSSDYLR